MGKSQETFGKKEKEKKRAKKRKEKLEKKEMRKENNQKGAAFEDMISYVDENGHLVDTPPDPSLKAFINDLNSGDKYFVHVSGLIDEIQENDKVTYDLERGAKGMNAVRVKKI